MATTFEPDDNGRILESVVFNLNFVLRILLDQIINQMRADAARIFLCDPKNKDLTFSVGGGFIDQYQDGVRYQYGEGLVGHVALNRRPFLVNDLSNPQNAAKRNVQIETEGFITYYGMPLIYNGCLQGVLEIFYRQFIEANREWCEMVSALAERISVAIDSAEHYKRILDFNLEIDHSSGFTKNLI